MSENKSGRKPLTLGKKLDPNKTTDEKKVRQSFGQGNSKSVVVEVRRKKATGSRQNDSAGDQANKELESRLEALKRAIQQKEESVKGPGDESSSLSRQFGAGMVKKKEEQEIESASKKDKKEEEKSSLSQKELDEQRLALEAEAQKASTKHAKKKVTHGKPPEDIVDEEEKLDAKKKNDKKPNAFTRSTLGSGRRQQAAKKILVHKVSLNEDDDDKSSQLRKTKNRSKQRLRENYESSKKITRTISIPDMITVSELSNRMSLKASDLIKKLMQMGTMVTINQTIDADTAELLVNEFGHTSERVEDKDLVSEKLEEVDAPEELLPRPPVVTIMGHVDHGKTSLLDALRETDVVAGEAGGITQHIGAYQVTLSNDKKITFIDTPGHAAFSEMRARGANVTDIVVIVIAADDGIKEQTLEAISHAKAAGVPVIIAINKIDKPEANVEKVSNELLSHDVILEKFGGDIMSVEVSAKQRINLDQLEEVILLQAEVLDLKANPNREAQGVVVESHLDKGRGPVATVLIQRGTLEIGDTFAAGTEHGKVRSLIDSHLKKLKEAEPGLPVEILGFNGAPVAGDKFIVTASEAEARQAAEYRLEKQKEQQNLARMEKQKANFFNQSEGEKKILSVIIKGDVHGSVEAIKTSLEKLENEEVTVNTLHSGVGGISDGDVALANASSALIIGFNVRASATAREAAKRQGVDIRYYSIIYNVIDEVKAILSGMLDPTLKEEFLGYAEIRKVFSVPKVGKVAGCMVTSGVIKRGSNVRLLRNNVVIFDGELDTLKRFKDEVKEAKEGFECGLSLKNYQDLKEGDMVECYEVIEVAREL